mgnify:CR=1 FL=1
MTPNQRGFVTLLKKEVMRFWAVLGQTVTAPVITALLYLLVFAQALSGRASAYDGISYTEFLVPGLIMMTVMQNAFANTSSSLIQSKVMGNLIFVLITPLSYLEFFLAFLAAAMIRGLVVGLGIYLPMQTSLLVVVGAAWGPMVENQLDQPPLRQGCSRHPPSRQPPPCVPRGRPDLGVPSFVRAWRCPPQSVPSAVTTASRGSTGTGPCPRR